MYSLKKVLFIFIFLLIYPTMVFAQAADLNPTASQESCTKEQADSGDPQSCTVGPDQGHDFLRYVGNDSGGGLFCQRSLCLNDSNNQPFEYKCSKDQADGLQPQSCKDSSGKDGLIYDRYSFTDSTGQLWCYKSECVSNAVTLSPTPFITAPPTLSPTPLPSGKTPEEIAVQNLNTGLAPPEIARDIQPKLINPLSIPGLINSFFAFLGINIHVVDEYAARAQLQQQAEAPKELKSQQPDSNLVQQVGENIGKKDSPGFYSVSIPDEAKEGLDKSHDFEKEYEKAYFPTGICPITGCK